MTKEDIKAVLDDALPRVKAIYDSLSEYQMQDACNLEDIAGAFEFGEMPDENFEKWISDVIYPMILRAESSQAPRIPSSSEYQGAIGDPIEINAVIVVRRDWGKEMTDYTREGHLTILKDDSGNIYKYMNTINIPDALEEDGFYHAKELDRVKLRATVKAHNAYKGTKQTVICRARKAEVKKHEPQE